MKLVIAIAALAALGAIGGTVWVGTLVREETVVAHPYDEGLGYDRERHDREALGWEVQVEPAPAPGAGGLAFAVRDAAGRPVEGAVTLLVGRPDSGRGQWTVEARPEGAGRYRAAVAFPAAGPWEVRFDVRRRDERVRLTRTVRVAEGAAACDLAAGPCTAALAGGGEVTLELGPRPLRAMAELAVKAAVRDPGGALDGAAVTVRFDMKGMEMFPAEARLAPEGAGHHAGRVVLVRCPSGRTDWTATVEVTPAGGTPRTAELGFRVAG